MGAGIFEKLGQVIKSARRGHLNIRYIYRYELFTVQTLLFGCLAQESYSWTSFQKIIELISGSGYFS